jgi:hypothetical protein
MKNLILSVLKYLYGLIVRNWKTTIAGFIFATIIQYLQSHGVMLTSEQADILSTICISVGAFLPHSIFNINSMNKTMICIFVLFVFSGCSLISSGVQLAGGCDKVSALAAQAVNYACKSTVEGGLSKAQSLGSAAEQNYLNVNGKDTVWYNVSYSDGWCIVRWNSNSGDVGSIQLQK